MVRALLLVLTAGSAVRHVAAAGGGRCTNCGMTEYAEDMGLLQARREKPAEAPVRTAAPDPQARAAARAPAKSALVVIDMQNDFINGSLPVAGAVGIIPKINELVSLEGWAMVVFTKDYHSHDHVSFAASHPGKHVFETIELNYTADSRLCGEEYSSSYTSAAEATCLEKEVKHTVQQTLWPVHCVQHSFGGKIHRDVVVPPSAVEVHKGHTTTVDSYGAIRNVVGTSESNLVRLLRDAGAENVFVAGLALDYCVKFTAIQAEEDGFQTFVVLDATKPVTEQTGKAALQDMEKSGVEFITSFFLAA